MTSLLAAGPVDKRVNLLYQKVGSLVFAGPVCLLRDCSPVRLAMILRCSVMLTGFAGQRFVFGDWLFGCVIGSDC